MRSGMRRMAPIRAHRVKLGILEGWPGRYSQGSLGAPSRNPGETGIPMANSSLFSRDRLGMVPACQHMLRTNRLLKKAIAPFTSSCGSTTSGRWVSPV